MSHNQNRYRFKLKGFDKIPQMKSDNSSPTFSKPFSTKQNIIDHKVEVAMDAIGKLGEIVQSFNQTVINMSSSMNILKQQVSQQQTKLRQSENIYQRIQKRGQTKSRSCIGPQINMNEMHNKSQNYEKQKMVQNLANNNTNQEDSLDIEQRFKLIYVENRLLQNKQKQSPQRKNQIFDWLSASCKKIFSATFKQLLIGSINTKVAKTYCSENLLYRLIQFIKVNDLTNKQIQSINQFLSQRILPYFQLKYPQSETNQINLRLSNKLDKVDDYNNNTNDLVYISNTRFQFNSKGDYSTEIMSVLNFIINSADRPVKYQDKYEEMVQKDRLVKLLRKQQEQNKKNCQKNYKQKKEETQKKIQQDQSDEDKQQMTLYTAFYNDIQQLFKAVEDQDEMFRMKQGLSPQQYVQKYKKIALAQKDLTKKQIYKDKVKAYTRYLIGRKISESVDEYTADQVKQGLLFIKNSQILRILNKWCTHLRDKFTNAQSSIEQRQQPFRMQDGSQGYLSKTQRIILSKLLQRQEENINKFLQQVLSNNYGFQESIAKKQLPKQFDWYSKSESQVGLFTAALFYNNENYIIGYLNTLIHSLLRVTTDFNEIINLEGDKNYEVRQKLQKNMKRLCINKIDIEKFMEFVRKKRQNKKKNFNYQSVPQLVTFRIGDLIRCKCSSKQKEVTGIYKQIMRISSAKPSLWKVNRIKNRLAQGTRDILINIIYRDSIVVEIQLQVDEAKSHFIMCSSSFKHYLYELGRAQFGPISEMSSIWMNHDGRSEFYRKQHNRLNIRQNRKQKVHNCLNNIDEDDTEFTEPLYSIQTFPFICELCEKLWTNSHFIETHTHCNICQKNICGYCEINMDIKIVEPNFRAALQGIFSEDSPFEDQNQRIPSFGACMNLYSKDTVVIEFRKIYYQYKTYVFESKHGPDNERTYTLFAEVTSQEQKKNFLEKHQILDLQKQIRKTYYGSEEQINKKIQTESLQIAQKYFLPKIFQQILDQKKSSILEEGMRITNQILESMQVFPDVEKINFSENNISDFDLIARKFPKLQIGVIAKNQFTKIPNSINILSKSITYLDFNNNQISELPTTFSELSQLKYLNLSRNKLKNLPQKFQNLTELKDLIIGYNLLEALMPLPLYLKRLDLQHNKFAESINIRQLNNLVFLNLAFNKLKYLEGLSNTQTLKTLDLSHNEINKHKFKNLYSLQNLILSFNHLQQIEITYEQLDHSNLKNLNLSNNKLKKLSQEFFRNIYKVQNLSLAENKLQFISEHILYLQNVQDLNLSAIRTVKFERRKNKDKKALILKKNNSGTQAPPKSNLLQVQRQLDKINEEQIPYDIVPDNIHLYLTSLTSLSLSNNLLPEIPQTISKMVKLKQLDLSSNRIKKVDMIITVDVLDLRMNKIVEFDQNSAQYLNTLKALYLKNNKCVKTCNPTQIKSIIKNLQIFDIGQSTSSQSSIGSRKSAIKSNRSLKSVQDSSQCSDNNSLDEAIQNNNQEQDVNIQKPIDSLPSVKLSHIAQRVPSGMGKRKKTSAIQEVIAQEADQQNIQNQDDI